MGADKNSYRRRRRLQQDEHGFQHSSPTHYPSWSSPRSHWSVIGPRNQHTTFQAKTHQHAQRKLARLAACAASVRPMACGGQTDDTGQTVLTVNSVILHLSRMRLSSLRRLGTLELSRKFFFVTHRLSDKLSHLRP
jgi:hypothetical protein